MYDAAAAVPSSAPPRESEVTVSAEDLRRLLVRRLDQRTARQRMGPFLAFVLVLCVHLALSMVDTRRTAEGFHRTQASLQAAHWESFAAVGSIDSFWKFTRDKDAGLLNAFTSSTNPADKVTLLLGPVLLRQWRVEMVNCTWEAGRREMLIVPPHMRRRFVSECPSTDFTTRRYCGKGRLDVSSTRCEYDTPQQLDAMINPPPWRGNAEPRVGDEARDVDSASLSGPLHDSGSAHSAYTVYLPAAKLGSSKADQDTHIAKIDTELAMLQNLSWIDQGTRAVSVEMLTHALPQAHMLTSLLLEIEPTNVVAVSQQIRYFSSLGGWFILVLDFCIVLYSVGDSFTYLYSNYSIRELQRTPDSEEGSADASSRKKGFFATARKAIRVIFELRPSFWVSTRLVELYFYGQAYRYRFLVWAHELSVFERAPPEVFAGSRTLHFDPLTLDEQEGRQAWEHAVSNAELAWKSHWWFALGVLMTSLRFFEVLRFTSLSMVSETVKSAAASLFNLLVHLAVIMVGWTCAGMLLYGRTMKEFKSFSSTLQFLLFLSVDGGINGLDQLSRIQQPVVTFFFFVSFLCIVAFVILNVTIGVITGHFMMLQNMKSDKLKATFEWPLTEVLTLRSVGARMLRMRSVVQRFAMLCLRGGAAPKKGAAKRHQVDPGGGEVRRRASEAETRPVDLDELLLAVSVLQQLQRGRPRPGMPYLAKLFGLGDPVPVLPRTRQVKIEDIGAHASVRVVHPVVQEICAGTVMRKLSDHEIEIKWRDPGDGGPPWTYNEAPVERVYRHKADSVCVAEQPCDYMPVDWLVTNPPPGVPCEKVNRVSFCLDRSQPKPTLKCAYPQDPEGKQTRLSWRVTGLCYKEHRELVEPGSYYPADLEVTVQKGHKILFGMPQANRCLLLARLRLLGEEAQLAECLVPPYIAKVGAPVQLRQVSLTEQEFGHFLNEVAKCVNEPRSWGGKHGGVIPDVLLDSDKVASIFRDSDNSHRSAPIKVRDTEQESIRKKIDKLRLSPKRLDELTDNLEKLRRSIDASSDCARHVDALTKESLQNLEESAARASGLQRERLGRLPVRLEEGVTSRVRDAAKELQDWYPKRAGDVIAHSRDTRRNNRLLCSCPPWDCTHVPKDTDASLHVGQHDLLRPSRPPPTLAL